MSGREEDDGLESEGRGSGALQSREVGSAALHPTISDLGMHSPVVGVCNLGVERLGIWNLQV